MASSKGPSGSGAINLDSYDGSVGPPMPPKSATTAVKVIIPTDKKTGPPKPASLGGTAKSGTGNLDTYWE